MEHPNTDIEKREELEAANVTAIKYLNGYNLFQRRGTNLVAVQEIGSRFHIIPAERPSISFEDSSKVIPALIEILGVRDFANGASMELARFLWKDWD
jgi:hypothetical protein